MRVEPVSAAVVTYRCPACQAMLQAGRERPEAWLRCPRCGRAGRPPAPSRPVVPVPVAEAEAAPVELVPVGTLADRREAVPARDWRIVQASGLFASTSLLLFSFLDSSVVGASIFGVLAGFCLVSLVRSARRRS